MKRYFNYLLTAFLLLLVSATAMADNMTVTGSGIGKLKLGNKISKLPDQIPDLYDKIEQVTIEDYDEGGEDYSYTVYRASLNNERVLEISYEEDIIKSITVFSKSLLTEKGLGLGSTPADIFAAGGRVITFNDGGLAFLCDGVLFFDCPLTDQGIKKNEQAYLGYEVTFDESDFKASGHPSRLFLSEEFAGSSTSSSSGRDAKGIIVSILFIAAILAMIGHMVYVNYFAKGFPEELSISKGSEMNNMYVSTRMDKLYNEEFTPYEDNSGEEPLHFPIGRKAAFSAKSTLKEIYENHMPVDGEAAEKLRKVSIVTNESFKRTFSGSIKFLIITIVVGAGACYLNKDATPLLYFIPSCLLYFFSCMAPNYVLMEKALKEMKTGKKSRNIMDGVLAGVLGIAASAPVIVEVTKDAHSGEVLDKSNDHGLEIIGLIVTFLLFIILAYAMLFIGILNYLRNYVLR